MYNSKSLTQALKTVEAILDANTGNLHELAKIAGHPSDILYKDCDLAGINLTSYDITTFIKINCKLDKSTLNPDQSRDIRNAKNSMRNSERKISRIFSLSIALINIAHATKFPKLYSGMNNADESFFENIDIPKTHENIERLTLFFNHIKALSSKTKENTGLLFLYSALHCQSSQFTLHALTNAVREHLSALRDNPPSRDTRFQKPHSLPEIQTLAHLSDTFEYLLGFNPLSQTERNASKRALDSADFDRFLMMAFDTSYDYNFPKQALAELIGLAQPKLNKSSLRVLEEEFLKHLSPSKCAEMLLLLSPSKELFNLFINNEDLSFEERLSRAIALSRKTEVPGNTIETLLSKNWKNVTWKLIKDLNFRCDSDMSERLAHQIVKSNWNSTETIKVIEAPSDNKLKSAILRQVLAQGDSARTFQVLNWLNKNGKGLGSLTLENAFEHLSDTTQALRIAELILPQSPKQSISSVVSLLSRRVEDEKARSLVAKHRQRLNHNLLRGLRRLAEQ